MKGWIMGSSEPNEYAHGIADDERHEGARVAFLRSTVAEPAGYGVFRQTILASTYLGRRVRLSAAVRTIDVDGWVGLWMRVDNHRYRSTAFDNMEDRPLSGTTPWARQEVVLDVAEDSVAVNFGALLSGKGEVRLAGFRLETVGSEVPVTGGGSPEDEGGPGEEPSNLDFSED